MQTSMFSGVTPPVTPEMVQPGTRWRHHSGRCYRVLMLTNQHSQQPEKFPLTVVYMDENQKTWSRSVLVFIHKFRPVEGGLSLQLPAAEV